MRNDTEREIEKEVLAGKSSGGQDGGRKENKTLDLIYTAVSEVMTTWMTALQAELKKDLSEFRTCFREDIKKQMDKFTTEINRKIQD